MNVKPCTEAPSNIQNANVKARIYVCAKAKCIEAFKGETYAKKKEKFVFKALFSINRTVRNHKTMPLPVTLDSLECINLIRHVNGTNNERLNNL